MNNYLTKKDKAKFFSMYSATIKQLAYYENMDNVSAAAFNDVIGTELFGQLKSSIISLFSTLKQIRPTFTVYNNVKLKSIRYDESSDSLGDDGQRDLENFLNTKQNSLSEIFHLLLVNLLFQPTDSVCFFEVKSVFSQCTMDIFVLLNSKKISVIDVDSFSLTKLDQYINNMVYPFDKKLLEEYIEKTKASFGKLDMSSHKEIQCELNRIFSDMSSAVASRHDLIFGAISFFDFLGWKGIWQDPSNAAQPLEEVTNLINDIRDNVIKKTRSFFEQKKALNGDKLSTIISISDTIALFTPQIQSVKDVDLLKLHADIAKMVLELSGKRGYPIRGAISFGRYSIMNNVMIGPGIDECASWHEKSDWIGAILTPSAQIILDCDLYNNSGSSLPDTIISYSVPMKSGIARPKYCVKWEISINEFRKMQDRTHAIMPEIGSKYLNTYSFLYSDRKEEK